jgi:SAM-dependent methyltransferase
MDLEPLTSSDWAVTGFEPDQEYVKAAHESASRNSSVTVRHAGLLDLDERSAFDLIAAVNDPYLYLLEAQSRRDALHRAYQALRPGGVVFLEHVNFLWVLKKYRDPPMIECDIDGVHVRRMAEHEIDLHAGTLTHRDYFRWTDESGAAGSATKTHVFAIVPFSEIRLFLEDLGFEAIRTFNGFADRAPAKLTGRRMLITAMVRKEDDP